MKKQKTLLLLLLALVCAICFAFALTACGDNNTNEIDLTPTEGLEYTLFQGTDPYYACTSIGTAEETDIVIAKEYEGLPVTAIEYMAFLECTNIKSIHIPNSVEYIGHDAFYGCTSLKSITIPNSVEYVSGNTFGGCTSLESITVASGNKNYYSEGNCLIEKDSKTLIAGCKNSIIPSNITSIGNAAFFECTSLSNITIPNSVTFIDHHAFYGCTSLSSITIPNSVTSIGHNAFIDCTSLSSITIPNSVTEIADGTFYNCTNLESINIPDSVTSIGYNAFSNCTSLASITIPDSVTSIGEYAFKNTAYYNNESNWQNDVLYIGKHLISAKPTISGNYVIKEGTVTLADGAFQNCTSLSSITIPNSVYRLFRVLWLHKPFKHYNPQ